VDERADEYATQEGLFLIKPSGDTVAIANGQDFVAKTWNLSLPLLSVEILYWMLYLLPLFCDLVLRDYD